MKACQIQIDYPWYFCVLEPDTYVTGEVILIKSFQPSGLIHPVELLFNEPVLFYTYEDVA